MEIRDPTNSQTGCSDPEARVERTGRTFDIGYKLHLSIDSETVLPLSSLFASTNQNEKKHSLTLLEKAKQVLRNSGAKRRSVIADRQYRDNKIRMVVASIVIPYPSNQKRGVNCLLIVNKKSGTYGLEDQKNEYHKRPSIEAVNSFLKTQYSMTVNKIRGLK